MLRRVFAIFKNVTIFWSNYNLDLRSYGKLFVLVFTHAAHVDPPKNAIKIQRFIKNDSDNMIPE